MSQRLIEINENWANESSDLWGTYVEFHEKTATILHAVWAIVEQDQLDAAMADV
jgi:hypothetical protein